jgi:hypothetical protein
MDPAIVGLRENQSGHPNPEKRIFVDIENAIDKLIEVQQAIAEGEHL